MNASFTCSKVQSQKKNPEKLKKKRKTRHNRKQEQERDLADSAEARCRVWLDSPSSLWLAQAGGWLLHGSGGLFIAGRLYQTPGPSLFSCCCCLVGCRYKLDCRRCGELPGGSQPDDRSRRRSGEISATPFFFFFNCKTPARKSSLRSQGGTVLFCFTLHLASLAVCCISFLSCTAQKPLITAYRGKDGFCNSNLNLFDPSEEAHSLMTPCKIDLLHLFRAYSWKFTAQVQGPYSKGNKLIYSHADQFRT